MGELACRERDMGFEKSRNEGGWLRRLTFAVAPPHCKGAGTGEKTLIPEKGVFGEIRGKGTKEERRPTIGDWHPQVILPDKKTTKNETEK